MLLDKLDPNNDGILREPLQSVALESSLVDSHILTAIWPEQLNAFRVCIVSINENMITSILIYTPSNWTYSNKCDIMLKLEHSHYTLMHVINDFLDKSPIESYIQSLTDLVFCLPQHIEYIPVRSTGNITEYH